MIRPTPRRRAILGAGLLVAALLTTLGARASDPSPVHHILILDDSGSMETDFDVHGFGLAVPHLFERILPAAASDRLTVLTLPDGTPAGRVPTLAPADFLEYPRQNGTFYAAAVREALRVARASKAPKIEIALVTDAEPTDPAARRAIDQALAADPRLAFRCFQLGTNDPGDLCRGRTAFASNGFDMARLMTTHLAASLGSVPRWGRLEAGAGQGATEIAVPRFARRLHLLLLGARAGEDFAAELVIDGARATHPVRVDHTRPMMPAGLLQQVARGLTSPMALPLGPSPRLAVGTLSLDLDPADPAPTLRLLRADGPVAWGVILEYDLDVEILASKTITNTATTLPARVHLTHRGVHVDDPAVLNELARAVTLEVLPNPPNPSTTRSSGSPPTTAGTQARIQSLTLDPAGWASVTLDLPADELGWTLVAKVGASAAQPALTSPEVTVTRDASPPGSASAAPLPGPTPTPPDPASPAAPPAPAPPAPISTAPSPTTLTRWLPPTLTLPSFAIEGQELGLALTVLRPDGTPMDAAAIAREGLSAALLDAAPGDADAHGDEHPMALAGDRFEVRLTPPAGTRRFTVVMRHPASAPGDPTETRSAPATLEVLPDAAVRLAPSHDAGTVEAGCSALERCIPLVTTGSRALDRIALQVSRVADPAVPGTFEPPTLTLRRGDATWPLGAVPVELPPSALPVEVCLAPPACGDAPPPATALATVLVAPADPRLATPDRVSQTRLFADVVPSTWLDCNLWWCLLIGGGLLFLFIVWGYVRPHAFPAGAFIQVADQERRLARDPGRPLRSVPHGRRGFYRTATCALDASGFTVKKSRPHLLRLEAAPGQIAVIPRGAAVERRQRGQWVPVDRKAEPFVLSGATYRVNQSFVFRVLA